MREGRNVGARSVADVAVFRKARRVVEESGGGVFIV
jgi:hypothetical protein